MKLKNDFVTNSSSTSYVAIIPKELDLKKHFNIMEQMGIGSNFIDDHYIEQFTEYFDEQIPEEQRANACVACKICEEVSTIHSDLGLDA